MARSAIKLVFAAMLALLATQAAAPSVRIAAAFEVVWQTQEAAAAQQAQLIRITAPEPARTRRTPLTSIAPIASDPEAVLVYQLPPPSPSFVA